MEAELMMSPPARRYPPETLMAPEMVVERLRSLVKAEWNEVPGGRTSPLRDCGIWFVRRRAYATNSQFLVRMSADIPAHADLAEGEGVRNSEQEGLFLDYLAPEEDAVRVVRASDGPAMHPQSVFWNYLEDRWEKRPANLPWTLLGELFSRWGHANWAVRRRDLLEALRTFGGSQIVDRRQRLVTLAAENAPHGALLHLRFFDLRYATWVGETFLPLWPAYKRATPLPWVPAVNVSYLLKMWEIPQEYHVGWMRWARQPGTPVGFQFTNPQVAKPDIRMILAPAHLPANAQ